MYLSLRIVAVVRNPIDVVFADIFLHLAVMQSCILHPQKATKKQVK